jgi:hypothetical protein
MTPEFAARKRATCDAVRSVFIDEPNAEAILGAMLARSGGTRPSERQAVMAQMEWLYGKWLREQAERHAIPIVLAQPRETLVDRILESAECERQGNQ